MKLKIGIALSVVVVIGCVIGFILPWYQITYNIPFSNNDAVATFRWKDYKCEIGDNSNTLKYDKLESCAGITILNKMEKTGQIFDTCLSFLVIGAALSLGAGLLQLILLLSPKLCRSIVWKILCIGTSCAAVAILFISFFTLLGLPKAFNDDSNGFNSCKDRWCKNIYGSDDNFKWIPGGGWWATLVACFFALCSGLFTLASNR
ncbi:hypothetical protein SAMD00019534_045920 [Acytostelium subglobosum LB1]|uniref:hypothetical protein n=1 Tax=Acytostelium subglobosum LB1 TaxID=1410327 RepID=UPI000644A51A|nr:hypothetical protein SAMD00019534_045920 [Acytostelium subglobosum LB1]GAM21417.1 hypothetical protein SAMD00019534_045920 [Acytostelium subglobosum LB1]|eukprot:XP_012755536.1 hypothetical protein SAMD00019534_045920 [Acytostelium subglobosum LB1]